MISAVGFLVPKAEPFIKHRKLARDRVGSVDFWRGLTDREAGVVHGPAIVIEALRKGIFPELGTTVRISDSKSDQYNSIDIFVNETPAEIKTERIVSINLLVQDKEGGHNPNLLSDGTIKETAPPSFTPEPGFVGYDADGHFVHYCRCGAWGDFGYGVHLRKDELGTWYCRAHRPTETVDTAANSA